MGAFEELSQILYDSLIEPVAEGCDLVAGITHDYTIDVLSDNGKGDIYLRSDDKGNLDVFEDLKFEHNDYLGLLHTLEKGINCRIDDSRFPIKPTILNIMRTAYLARYCHP